MALRERQQSDVARLFDGPRDATLMRGADAGEAAGNDLAAFSDKALQQTDIAIRNGVDFFNAEFADLFAAKKLASAGT